VLFAAIGVMGLVRAARTRRGVLLLMAGAVLTVVGIVLPSVLTVIGGMLVLIRGVAVILGVSELHRRVDGGPACGPDIAGFRTPPFG
jgi:hypothetical protein